LYRCHVCRLELQIDVKTDALVIAPLTPDPDADAREPRKRGLPNPIVAGDKPKRPKKGRAT
jgi:hypothetical protein